MYYDITDTEKEVKSKDLKKWWLNQFESIVGEFPEIEKPIKEDNHKLNEKPFLKKHKTLRYSVFPFVLILIIIDESYIRIKNFIKKIDESE